MIPQDESQLLIPKRLPTELHKGADFELEASA